MWIEVDPNTYQPVVGDKVKQVIEIELSPLITWLPDQILDWLVENIVAKFYQIEAYINDRIDGSIELLDSYVEVIEPGKKYHIVFIYRIVEIGTKAVVAPTLVAAILYILTSRAFWSFVLGILVGWLLFSRPAGTYVWRPIELLIAGGIGGFVTYYLLSKTK